MSMITEPDASGGNGSWSQFGSDFFNTVTQGLQTVAAGELAKKYGFGFSDGRVMVDADGNIRSAAAPSKSVSSSDKAKSLLQSPLVVAGLVATAVLVAILIARR